jgi:hypothetical protein
MDLFSFLSLHFMCVPVTVVTGHSVALSRRSHLVSTMSSLLDVLVHDIAKNAAEVTEAMRQRVPPPPLSRSPSSVLADSRAEDGGDVPSPPPETRFIPSPNVQFRTP